MPSRTAFTKPSMSPLRMWLGTTLPCVARHTLSPSKVLPVSTEELRELRQSLERAYDGERRVTKWARRERRRAEAAETKCNLLMAQIWRQKERTERPG